MIFYKPNGDSLKSVQLSLFLIVLFFLFDSCQKENIPSDPPPPEEEVEQGLSLPTEEGMKNLDLSPGDHDGLLPMSYNRSMSYAAFVPAEIKEGNIPLIFALHGGSGDHFSARRFMDCLPLPALKETGAILFAPTGGNWWTDGNDKRIQELVRLAKAYWPIDTSKVAVMGYSNGGTGSIHFAVNQPHLFSAAIPMAALFMDKTCPGIPTYFIHGSDDENYSASELKQTVEQLAANKCDVQINIVDGYSHGDACRFKLELRGAAGWLMNEVWK